MAPESACSPTKVVIQLATQVVIPNFSRDYEDTSLQDFRPSYVALDDGSLLASPFLADLSQALQSLVVLTIILLFFIRNVAVSGHYYFSRSKIIQDRRLFLALFVSQMVAPAGMLPTLASYFDPSRVIDCTLVLRLERCVAFFSLSILISAILGFKAYRILRDSRVVLVSLSVLQIACTVVFVLEMISTQGRHRLSGSCARSKITRWIIGSVSIQLAEIIFIAVCFLVAVFQARSAVSGHTIGSISNGGLTLQFSRSSKEDRSSQEFSGEDSTSVLGQRCYSSPQEGRYSFASKLLPRMDSLFKQVVKDELRFSTLIAVLSILAVAFTLIGLNCKTDLSVQGWLSIPWCFISLIIIKTFDRALRRHEEEAFQLTLTVPTTPRGLNRSYPSPRSRSRREPTDDISDINSNPFADPRDLRHISADGSRGTMSSILTTSISEFEAASPT